MEMQVQSLSQRSSPVIEEENHDEVQEGIADHVSLLSSPVPSPIRRR